MRMRYIVVCCLSGCTTFSTLSYKWHDSRKKKKVIEPTKFWFSLQILSQTFFNLRRNEWDNKKIVFVFTWSTCYSCQILMKLEFSRQIVEKHYNVKFHENSSCGSRVNPCEQTDRQTDMTQLIVAFRNFAKAPKNWPVNVVQGTNRCMFWDKYKTCNYMRNVTTGCT